MLSNEQKEIIKQNYSDKLWGALDAANVAGDMTVANLKDNANNFIFELDKTIMMTIAFEDVRKDSAKQDKKTTKKK